MKNEGNTSNKLRYAIMGGTFDPIHFGHLAAAEEVRQKLHCDKIIFIPSGNPPHKKERTLTDAAHRFAMTKMAVASNPNFEVSSIEINREGYSYTLDTAKQLLESLGRDAELLFITGADAILEVETWYRVDELLKLCHFVVVTRPGYDKSNLEQKLQYFRSKYGGELFSIDVPGLNISSTEIRNRVSEGVSIKYLVPEVVEQYIYDNGLYKEFSL